MAITIHFSLSHPSPTNQIKPIAARSWQQRLKAITPIQINDIFARITEGRITPSAAKFAIDLLDFNRQALASI